MLPRMRSRGWRPALLGVALAWSLAGCSRTDPELERGLTEARASLDAANWEAAAEAARALLVEHPGEARARTVLGQSLLGQARQEKQVVDPARYDLATQSGDAASLFDPSLFRTEVRYDEALAAEGEAELRAAVESGDAPLEAFLGLAALYAETDRVAEERETVMEAAHAFPGQDDAAARLVTFGERYFRNGRYSEALQILGPLAEAFPGHPVVALDHAAAMFASGRYEAGIAALDGAVARAPRNPNMLRTLGQMHLYRRGWAAAAAAFADLAEVSPEDRLAMVHHGAALMPVDPVRAAEILRRARGEEEEPEEPATAIAGNFLLALDEAKASPDDLVHLAAQLNRNGLPHLGVATCGLLLRRAPGSVPARIMLAFLYDGVRYFDMALEQLDDAAGILREQELPDELGLADLEPHYGRVYFHMGEYRKAVEAFSRAEDPGRYSLAVALSYESLGEFDDAYHHFEEVVQRGIPDSQVREARKHLERDVYAALREGR